MSRNRVPEDCRTWNLESIIDDRRRHSFNMTSRKIVLVTDYAWPNLKPEHQILAEIGAELLVAESGSVEELVQLAPRADAILFNWKPIPARVLGAAKKCVGLCRYGIGL